MVTDKASFRDWLEWGYQVGVGVSRMGFLLSSRAEKRRRVPKITSGKALAGTPASARRNKRAYSSLQIIMFTYD